MQKPVFAFKRDGGNATNTCTDQQNFYLRCVERIPVVSTGVSFRADVLGYFILEAYIASRSSALQGVGVGGAARAGILS